MQKTITLWLIENIIKWYVLIPAFILVFILVGTDIILVPVLGVFLAVAIGVFLTLNALREDEKK